MVLADVEDDARRAAPSPADGRGDRGDVGAPGSREVLVVGGLAVSAAGAAAALLPLPGPVRLVLLLVFLCLGPGAAVVAHVAPRDRLVGWALTLTAGLNVSTGLSVLTLWTGTWAPRVLVVALAAASALSLVLAGRGGPHRPGPTPAPAADRPAHRRARSALLPLLVPLLALVAWRLSVRGVDETAVGPYGLLPELPPLYYLALVSVLVSAVVLLARAVVPRVAAWAHVVVLVLLVHGTVPLVLEQPQYSWTYKHVGVVEFVVTTGGLRPDVDIYHQWPAFFAVVAVLSDVSGLGVVGWAEWAPVFFNLVYAVLLAALVRVLRPGDGPMPWLAVLVFLCTSWVGQDYLAPQALALALLLGLQLVVLLTLRTRPRRPAPGAGRFLWLRAALVGADASAPVPVTGVRGRQRTTLAVAAVCAVFAVLVATHQLTPYIVILGVAGLVVLGLVRPRVLVVALVVIAAVYLVPRWGFLMDRFQLFSGFDLRANTESNVRGVGSEASRATSAVVRALSLTVWVAALAVVVAHRRRVQDVVVPAVLFLAPFALFLGQNYGGEGVFRVYLTGLPWASYLVALGALALGRRTRRGTVVRGVVLVALCLACLQGLYGQLAVNRVSTAEVEASRYLYAHAGPDAVLLLAAPMFPTRVSASYPDLLPLGRQADGGLMDTDELDGQVLDERALPEVERIVSRYGATRSYVVLSRSGQEYVRYFGLLPEGSLDALGRTLEDAPGWTTFYRNEDVTIFERVEDDR